MVQPKLSILSSVISVTQIKDELKCFTLASCATSIVSAID